jgi:hypothetical protein
VGRPLFERTSLNTTSSLTWRNAIQRWICLTVEGICAVMWLVYSIPTHAIRGSIKDGRVYRGELDMSAEFPVFWDHTYCRLAPVPVRLISFVSAFLTQCLLVYPCEKSMP